MTPREAENKLRYLAIGEYGYVDVSILEAVDVLVGKQKSTKGSCRYCGGTVGPVSDFCLKCGKDSLSFCEDVKDFWRSVVNFFTRMKINAKNN